MNKNVKILLGLAGAGVAGSILFSSCKTISQVGVGEDSRLQASEVNQDAMDAYNKLSTDLSSADTACNKLDTMWKVIADPDYQDFVDPVSNFGDVLQFGNGDAHRFWKIFEGWNADDWEGTGTGSEVRPYIKAKLKQTLRLTHRFGVYALLEYESVGSHPYTGMFKGNPCVLGRLSSAVPTTITERFTPALSAKFFVNGAEESQVLIAQHDIGGQNSGQNPDGSPRAFEMKDIDNNFYKKPLSNRLSFENLVPNGFGAFSRFLWATQLIVGDEFDPRELSARHLAKFKHVETGSAAVSRPKGPRFIWLLPPSQEVKQNFHNMANETNNGVKRLDFREHFMSYNSGDQLPYLFNVYASDTWSYEPQKSATLIGRFKVRKQDNYPTFVTSDAADIRLYFKHTFGDAKMTDANVNATFSKDFPATETKTAANGAKYKTWDEEMFVKNCALGARKEEVKNGSFLKSAILTNARYSDKDEHCAYKILGPKFSDKISEVKDKGLENVSLKVQEVVDAVGTLASDAKKKVLDQMEKF